MKKLSQETFVTNEIIFRAPKLSHYFPSRQDWIEKHQSLEDRYDCLIKSRSLGFEGPSDEGVNSHSDEEQCCDGSTSLPKIEYSVYHGDISEETADAIVIGVAGDFDLNWGEIAPVVLRKSGGTIQEECISSPLVCLESQNLRVTEGCDLPCAYVFHLVTPDTADELIQGVLDALEETRDLGISSISLSTFGARGIGIGVLEVAISMCEAFQKYSDKHQCGATLKHINVVVHEQRFVPVFQQHAIPGDNITTFSRPQTLPQIFCSAKEKWRVTVTSLSQESNDKVIEELMELKSRIIVKKEIKDDNIAKFEKNEIFEIKKIANKCGAKIKIYKSPKLSISGLLDNVERAKKKILVLLEDLGEAVIVAQHCVWKMENVSGSLENFPLRVSRVIVSHYEKSPTSMFDVNMCGRKYKINLDNLTYSGPSKRRKILRKSREENLPPEWAPMNDEVMKRITLSPTSPEYIQVQTLFNKSNPGVSVQKIERIQNPYLYHFYQMKKQVVEKNMLNNNESASRELFHGVLRDDVDAICRDGYDAGLVEKNATTIGKGLCFAVDSTNSMGYCDRSGARCMILSLVLTGNYCLGNISFTSPPSIGVGPSARQYDSVVDNVSSPQLFLVFKDSKIYPNHLVTFQ